MAPPAQAHSRFDEAVESSLDRLRRMRRFPFPSPVDPPPEPGGKQPTLTIGLATYDDFDGAYFTVTSLLAHHAEAMRDCEIVILDNHPEGVEAESLHALAEEYSSSRVRYIPYNEVQSTAVRDVIFSFARGRWVMILDSHVLLAPRSLDALLDFIAENPDSRDMIQGPLIRADGSVSATHMEPVFRDAMFGTWGTDERIEEPDCAPFEIPMHGLALFAIAKQHWPGIHPRFRGFGGEEGYVHEKVRQAGGKIICLPTLRWHHRFARPRGVPYEMNFPDRVNNYLLGWKEIDYDATGVHRAFSDLIGDHQYLALRNEAEHRLHHPGAEFDAVCIASDDDHLGDWRAVHVESERQGIEIERIAVSGAQHGEGWWDACVQQVIDRGSVRRWRNALLIDERLGLPLDLLYGLNALTRSHPRTSFSGLVDGRPRVQILQSALDDASQLTGHIDQQFELSDFISPVVSPSPLIGWTVNSAESFATWESSYARWAEWGFGESMHRLPAVIDAPPELQLARGWAQALTKAAEEAPGQTVLIAQSELWFSEDGGPLFEAVRRRLQNLQWSICTLSGSGDAEVTPDLISGTESPDAGAVLVHPDRVAELRKTLPSSEDVSSPEWVSWMERWGDINAWLAALASREGGSAWATSPQLVATHANWTRGRPEHSGRMRR